LPYNNNKKGIQMNSLTLEQKIVKAAQMIVNGETVSFRGASPDTVARVERMAKRMQQDLEFPECPCGECE
jgi:hypothetical protein